MSSYNKKKTVTIRVRRTTANDHHVVVDERQAARDVVLQDRDHQDGMGSARTVSDAHSGRPRSLRTSLVGTPRVACQQAPGGPRERGLSRTTYPKFFIFKN